MSIRTLQVSAGTHIRSIHRCFGHSDRRIRCRAPIETHQADRAVRGGWHTRHPGAPHCERTQQANGAAGGHRQPRRGERHNRLRDDCEGGAGRLYLGLRGLSVHHQSHHVRKASLRHGKGLPAGGAAGLWHQCLDGDTRAARPISAGLVEYARAQPGKLSYGGIGGGGSQQLSIELFKSMTGTQIVQVSYKGMQQAITDTIAGQIHIVCDNAPSILPHIQAGRLRAIGVTGLKRIQAAPDIPPVDEAAVPGYEMAPSSGYVLPARTPRDIVLRMNAEINQALISPAVSEKLVPAGLVIAGGTPEQFAEHLRRETAKWAGVIKTAGIKPQ